MKTVNYQVLNTMAEKNAVIVFGGYLDKAIPVAELAQSFDFNFKIYNRSMPGLSLRQAKAAYESSVAPISPEGVLLHLGEEDLDLFRANPSEFDRCYIDLIATVKKYGTKSRIALVSLYNAESSQTIADMNRHIKAIADSEKCDFINIDNAKVWNPNATKEVISFVYSLGFEQRLSIKKPLNDIAKILYSYAYNNLYTQNEKVPTYA